MARAGGKRELRGTILSPSGIGKKVSLCARRRFGGTEKGGGENEKKKEEKAQRQNRHPNTRSFYKPGKGKPVILDVLKKGSGGGQK